MNLWMPSLPKAIDDFEDQNHAALNAMSEYLSKLPKGSPVIEIGSRNGDLAVAMAKRFPELYIQPTEGTGQTSQTLFSVLEERIRLETIKKGGKEQNRPTVHGSRPSMSASPRRVGASGKNQSHDTIRLMQPRPFDASQESSFTTSVGHTGLGALVTLNALQYLTSETVVDLLAGAKKALRRGGYVLFAGQFFEGGEVSYKSMLYHSALQQFEKKLSEKNRNYEPVWGLHDANWMRQQGEQLGLDFVALKRIGVNDADDCLMLVMRKPLPPKQENQRRIPRLQ